MHAGLPLLQLHGTDHLLDLIGAVITGRLQQDTEQRAIEQQRRWLLQQQGMPMLQQRLQHCQLGRNLRLPQQHLQQ